MTIQEMARIYKRICVIHREDFCEGCPLLPQQFNDAEDCMDALIKYPDEYEKALLNWAKENPAPTNRDKFFEVFGDKNYKYDECCRAIKCESLPCHGCDWWNKEYVEPEKERE